MALIATRLLGADYFVAPAPTGNDRQAGTADAPWATIQKAADSLAPGDTAFVHGGVYRERVKVNVSGSAGGGFVTIRNFPNETPIIDPGAIQPPQDAETGLFVIKGRSYVIIRGFELRNFKAVSPADNQRRLPVGIQIRGAAHHIEIRENNIHDIWNHFADGNAFGIAVYGDTTTPMTRIVIDSNEIHHCRLGNSESLTINGNVTDFEVTNNRVHDNTNIGIVCIGHEGTCPDPAQDRARDGIVRGNAVWKCTSTANPAYGNHPGAGGIYVDGGTRIVIERNVSRKNDIGIELASEHFGKTTDFVTVRDNFIWKNQIGGIFLGGAGAENGGSENNPISNNTLFENDTRSDGNGEVQLGHRVFNNAFTQNIFAAGAQGLIISNPVADVAGDNNTGNVFDYNLHFSPAGMSRSTWQWKNRMTTGFAGWKSAAGQDGHSLFADPRFVSTAPPDLHLQPSSPAKDSGDPMFTPATGELDIDSSPRKSGAAVDLGADELP